MTNGEKIKEIFPYLTKQMLADNINIFEWWNAEYKEPTPKNETLVSLDVYKQVAKERDIAIQQLHELGYDFGQKIELTNNNDCAEQNGCTTCSLDDGDDCCRKLYEESMQELTTKNDLRVDCIVDVLGSYTDLDIPYKREIAENILTKLPSVTLKSCDAISRQAVIDEMEKRHTEGDCITKGFIKNMPSVTPQPRWILVEEKLPEIHNYTEKYLVTLERGWVHTAIFTECDGNHWWSYDDVVAWMPLPLPYREVKK